MRREVKGILLRTTPKEAVVATKSRKPISSQKKIRNRTRWHALVISSVVPTWAT
jgi:hypothetical protein